jgi:hypothetical protein
MRTDAVSRSPQPLGLRQNAVWVDLVIEARKQGDPSGCR